MLAAAKDGWKGKGVGKLHRKRDKPGVDVFGKRCPWQAGKPWRKSMYKMGLQRKGIRPRDGNRVTA